MTAAGDVSVLLGGPSRLDLEVMGFALSLRNVSVAGYAVSAEQVVVQASVLAPDVVLVVADAEEWGALAACAGVKQLEVPSRVLVLGALSDDAGLMSSVRAGADGFVCSDQGIDEIVEVLLQVARGETSIPGGMLGSLLRGLIDFRREDDDVVERYSSLGRREREVLAELVAGLDHHSIAAKLHLSPHTARTHTQNIFAKLGVHSRLEAARLVLEHDLLARFGVDAASSAVRR